MKVSEVVYSKLRRRLVSGYYLPGSQLKEEALAQDFDVSRTPVRNAIARLTSEGLLIPGEKRGALVTPWGMENTADVFALRVLLEGHGAYLCAKKASDEQIAVMEQTCEEMERQFSVKGADWIKKMDQGNRVIHEMLYEASGSPYLRLSGKHLLEVPQVIGGFFIYEDADVEESLRQHREIVKAIKLHNGDWARSAVACHLNAALERFRRRTSEE
ncbi:GntR family transcriptional regulator [Martelella mediterranea]|uniref:Putative HTH-type transcriptional regulator YdfH n=1 Tax=Martelella mediterranea DSM 17316 TaxID=1122214 RepID=A0A1U9YZQ0_9HYPH|nr:GntR family transcriptional regulator [Martelella mediterranea]AQZ50915.1 putative HTH-type transcriptional regulator YdfH [Martelella mediterranea DSM 17316]